MEPTFCNGFPSLYLAYSSLPSFSPSSHLISFQALVLFSSSLLFRDQFPSKNPSLILIPMYHGFDHPVWMIIESMDVTHTYTDLFSLQLLRKKDPDKKNSTGYIILDATHGKEKAEDVSKKKRG